jgi:Ca2+-binding EF-hand superfamily protein
MKKTTKLYYSGVSNGKVDKDKLSYAKAKWLQKRGVNIMQMDRNSEEESRKLFRYIDYDNDGYITKQ